MLIRLVHTQDTQGPLLITDIDSGLPNEEFGLYRKQPGVYLPYYRTFFGADGLVEVDRDNPGFIDLVPSDKVRLSLDRGVLAKFEEEGFLEIIEIDAGALNAPEITGITGDGVDGVDGEGGEVVIEGLRFASVAPDVTSVSITDGDDTLTFTEGDTNVTFTGTTITIAAAANTLTDFVTEASVTANGQTDTATP
jgi:hypothetical protein